VTEERAYLVKRLLKTESEADTDLLVGDFGKDCILGGAPQRFAIRSARISTTRMFQSAVKP
jgi:hypothetical protein